jgi:hypothetical protein
MVSDESPSFLMVLTGLYSYIVDYEDCLVPSVEKQKSLTFTNDQFNLWKLEEDRYKDSI